VKYRVPVHISGDIEVEVSAGKNPDPNVLRQKAEEAAQRKMQSVLGGGKITGECRVRATPTKAKTETGQPAFRQAAPRKPRPVRTATTTPVPQPQPPSRQPPVDVSPPQSEFE
jgi:hypothetical protein